MLKIGGDPLILMAGTLLCMKVGNRFWNRRRSSKSLAHRSCEVERFKPRTSPYSFQGLGEEGLQYLAEARDKTGLLIITELMDSHDLRLVEQYTDIIQIGAAEYAELRCSFHASAKRKSL